MSLRFDTRLDFASLNVAALNLIKTTGDPFIMEKGDIQVPSLALAMTKCWFLWMKSAKIHAYRLSSLAIRIEVLVPKN